MRPFLSLIFSMVALPGSAVVAEVPTLEVSAGVREAVIDGRLDEDFWSTAQSYRQLHSLGGPHSKPKGDTEFRVALQKGVFLIGVKCQQAMEGRTVRTLRRGVDTVCHDDSLELFLSAEGKGGYQFVVNSGGVIFDQQVSEKEPTQRKWSVPWEAVVSTRPDGWTAEIAIPITSLHLLQGIPFSQWRFNLCRTFGEEKAYYSWAPVITGYADWQRHGRMNVKGGPSIPNEPTAKLLKPEQPRLMIGKNHLLLEWQAKEGVSYRFASSLRKWEPGTLPERVSEGELITASNGSLLTPLELTVTEAGAVYELVVSLDEAGSGGETAADMLVFTLSGALKGRVQWPVYLPSDNHATVYFDVNLATFEGCSLEVQFTTPEGNLLYEKKLPIDKAGRYTMEAPLVLLKQGQIIVKAKLADADTVYEQWQTQFHITKSLFPLPSSL